MTLRLLLALALALLLAPAAPAANLLTTDLRVSGKRAGTCLTPATGDGVVRRAVTTDATGLIWARLRAAGGDWDVAVFDGAGRRVAGSAHFGALELAEGFVRGGQALTVQACRRSGRARLAQLSVQNVPLPSTGPGRLQLVRVFVPTAVHMDLLTALDLDLTEHGREGYLDVLLHGDEDLRILRRSGLRFDTLVEDVAAADRAAAQVKLGPPDGTMPSGRVDYRRLPDFSEDMKKLAAENPALVKPITLPHPTLEGRPVEGVEVTDNVRAADGKPVFLNMGVHHAREWPSGEMAMEWAFELVNKFNAGDERAVGLLKKARVIVVPIVNPDGYNLSRESQVDGGTVLTDVGFAYKRKNCRVTDGALPAPGECGLDENRNKGTDPNRNYGGFWGAPGASPSANSDTYRGAGPFSEPETQNVKALVSSRQVTTLITNHTYSDLILRPPGLASTPPPPDEGLLKELSDAMAAENGYTSQPSYDLYDTSGTTEDWSYYATGGLGYTFEIGRLDNVPGYGAVAGAGFHPPYPYGVVAEWFGKQPTGGGNREAYYLALESTANEKRHAVLTGRALPGATVSVGKTFTSTTKGGVETGPRSFEEVLGSSMTAGPSGEFEFHVNPSTRPLVAGQTTESWVVTCTDAQGRVVSSGRVEIARGERKDLGGVCDRIDTRPVQFDLTAKPRKTSLRALARRGLTVAVTCSQRCDVRAGLFQGKRRVGGAKTTGVETATLRVKLTRAGAKRLRRAKRAKLRLKVDATAPNLADSVSKTLKLKR